MKERIIASLHIYLVNFIVLIFFIATGIAEMAELEPYVREKDGRS